MALPTITTFTANTQAKSAEVNTNFDNLKNRDTISAAGTVTLESTGDTVEIVTSDNKFVAPYSRFSIGPSTSQSISNSSFTKVQFDTAAANVGSHFNTTTNRFVAPVAGVLSASAGLQYQSAPNASTLFILFYKNGSEVYAASVTAGAAANQGPSLSSQISLAANDYVEVYAWQNSGGSLSLSNNVARVYFTGLFFATNNS